MDLQFHIPFTKRNRIFDILDESKSVVNKEYVDDLINDDFFSSMHVKKDDVDSKLGNLFSTLRKESISRKERYMEYAKAAKDPVIGQAIEMMADDATQFDVDRQKTVWIESKDKKYEKVINGIIQDYIEPFIDTVASMIVSRGEFAFKVTKETKEKRDGYYDVILLPYKKIERLNHLILEDQSHYFFEVDDITNMNRNEVGNQIKEDTEFLHFINYSIENSVEVDIKIQREGDKKQEIKPVFVLQGESIITDKVLETFRILSALENALISMRLAKSKIVRFINVDISKLSDNKKAQAIVNYIHSAIAENEAISSGTYASSAIQAEPVTVTIPTRNGVGQVQINEFATSADIKDIADIDHFMSKLFAGLRTPRSYFNYDEALPGGGVSGASLAKMDIRYARATKKVQRVIVNAIRDLIDIFNKKNNIDEKGAPEYQIKIVKINSAEDADKYFEFEQRLGTVAGIMQGIMSPEGGYNKDALNAYIKYFTLVIPVPAVVEWLQQLQKNVGIISKPIGLKTTGVLKTEE